MFESLSGKFATAFSALRNRGRIAPGDIDEMAAEIRQALLDGDVSLAVAEHFVSTVSARAHEALPTLRQSTNPSQAIFEIVNEELISILGGQARRVRFSKNPPTIIMLAGLQGSGKTTLAGKLSKYFASQGNTPLLVAADLQRPNAVTQLQVVGEQAGVPVFAPEPGNGVGDPVAVAKAGVEFARSKLHNLVIVDTAGRLGVDEALMKEASNIRAAISPDEVIFVVDAMIGQDAVRTAQAFLNGVGFDAVALTKLDGDARGGAALSIAHVTQRPIMFASTGEKLADFDLFYPDRMASRILGMGDIASLAEQAKAAFDTGSAEKFEKKFAEGEDFTLEDFLEQMQAMKKMGSMSKLLGMLPGANSGAMKKQLESFDESEMVRTQAIIQSMTPGERTNPKILNGSRRVRIALGSGRSVKEVNTLVDRFSAAQKAMKQLRNGGIPAGLPAGLSGGIPGMPPMPRGGGFKHPLQQGNQKNQKKKSRSGNPAKRAAEEGR